MSETPTPQPARQQPQAPADARQPAAAAAPASDKPAQPYTSEQAGNKPASAPAADKKDAEKKPEKKEGKDKSGIVTLADGDIEIFAMRPLPEFDGFATQAFEANDKRVSTRQMAILAGRGYVPRTTYGGSYKNIKHTALLRMLDVGIVDWTDGKQYLAYVFDRPNGRKLMAGPDAKPLQLPEDKIIPVLIQPIIQLLAEMRNADMVHGAINLENMYLTGGEGSETVILGECLTSAASARQHPIYETIERSMAQPMGRGTGMYKDDLYAFGICVAMVARGENLITGRTAQMILQDKMENTSYSSVAGRERLPNGVGEFLRGVLNDDEAQRWDVDDALRWLEGRRLSPKQPRVPNKAARPYIFMEHKYWELRSLALAFSQHIVEAATESEGGQFDSWVKRSFEDKILDKRLEKVYETERMGGRDKLVCRVCMTLDPFAPVRYKTLSVFPSGFGDALADAMSRGEDLQVYGDIILQQIFNDWVNLRYEIMSDSSNLISTFEKCRNFLSQKIPGYGLERILYVLNAEAACMSPLLKNYIVLTPGHLLLALDDMAKKGAMNERIFDRHMVAFISVREPKMIDPHLGHVISAERGNQMIGIIRTLAAIQKRFNVWAVPAITDYLIGLIAPACERLSDRDARAELIKKIEKLKGKGDLGALLEMVDNDQALMEDNQRYMQARVEYLNLQRERDTLSEGMKGKKFFGYATGRQVSMLVSAVVGTVGIVGYLIMRFSGG